MALTKGYKALLADADAAVKALSVEEVHAGQNDPGMVILDIRDVRELKREGMLAGARHAPRGMLEFWAAPDSPYFKDWLADPDQDLRPVLRQCMAQRAGSQGPARYGHGQHRSIWQVVLRLGGKLDWTSYRCQKRRRDKPHANHKRRQTALR